MKTLIDELIKTHVLPRDAFKTLLTGMTPDDRRYLTQKAQEVRRAVYGNDVYIRGLIEFTNYCKNDCLYCGIRRSNRNADRYRLTKEQILDCCRQGYALGFRTFVLQGGEDPFFDDEKIAAIVRAIKAEFPDCAVTLSIGEKSFESYQAFFKAGADRYLLRHETANSAHYQQLHPPQLSLENRMRCLRDLKSIGYQTGCGFMVGSPFQTTDTIIDDLLFLHDFQPEMVGIGPFIPHKNTPFRDRPAGTLQMTLTLLSIIRLILPRVLLPATTALGTIDPTGREQGILAGANVVMPNLSPQNVRSKYLLYNDKICTGDEAAESLSHLKQQMEGIGYRIVESRGDFKKGSNEVCMTSIQ